MRLLAIIEKIAGGKIWPARWRLPDRLGWNWPASDSSSVIWMHAASLGECKGLWALAQKLAPASLVFTCNTITALKFLSGEIDRSGNAKRWHAMLAPFDHPAIVEKFLARFHVQTVVLFEMELWPHFISVACKKEIPLLWVSARLTSQAQRRFTLFHGAAKNILAQLNWIQTQSGEEADALRAWGCTSVSVGTDLRGLHYSMPTHSRRNPDWSARNGIAFLSFHADELNAVLPALNRLTFEAPVYFFPREMSELKKFQSPLSPLGFHLHSQNPGGSRLIVDSFGEIPGFLERCHAAVVGGSFAGSYGGHNLWEPLAAGVSIAIGPRHWNQAYLAVKLSAAGLLHVADGTLNAEILRKSNGDPGAACEDFIAKERVILHQAVEHIREHLDIAVRRLPSAVGVSRHRT